VLAEAPVRVDLAGGWSDTPPQALERGGRVLNVALELHGIRPIRTEVEIIPELRIELCCRETGLRTVIEEMDRLRAYTDPSDPFCLHKAALFEAGFFTERDRGIASRLRGLGGGVRICTESRVPKGSGLGTSSILGATLVAALGEIYGRSFAPADCSNRVLRLEQRLTTGGGWQDQVGALTPGFKIASTAPGLDQTPEVAEVNVSQNVIRELEARLVVFYTGVPRLARNVLQRVVSRYLMGEREVVEGLEEMPGLVSQLESALREGDLRKVGECLSRSWYLNKQIEPTASNSDIERLFTAIQPWVFGAKLAGAGGGGFLFALARDAQAVPRIVQALIDAGAPASGYHPARVAQQGLVVETNRA
jgi:fucokinase